MFTLLISHQKTQQLIRHDKEKLIFQIKVRLQWTTHLLKTDDNGQFISEGDIANYLVGLIHAVCASLHGTITLAMKNFAELPNVYG